MALFREMDEVAGRCDQCDAAATARCQRCSVALCAEHQPGPRRRCTPCEDDYVPFVAKDHGLIVFQTDRDGNDELYRVDVQSGSQVNLTENPGVDTIASVSPCL